MTDEDLNAELFVVNKLAETEKYQNNTPGVTPKYWGYVQQITSIRAEINRRELK